jgi:hypothetical protein
MVGSSIGMSFVEYRQAASLQATSLRLYDWAGTSLVPVALGLVGGIGVLSSLLANTPVVAVSILRIKG